MPELSWRAPLRGVAVARPGFTLRGVDDLPLARLQLFARDADVLAQAAAAFAAPLPPVGAVTALTDRRRLAGTAPGAWLALGAPGTTGTALSEALAAPLAGLPAVVAPATDGFVLLQLAGPAVATVLARGTTLDPAQLRPGRCAATRFAQVPALLLPDAEGVLLLARRSLAAYLRDWFDAASVDCR